jgi:hypothetical protein
MSTIGNVIDGALGSMTSSGSGTSLQDFLSKFSSSDGKWVDTIDPFATFDLTMKLYPAPPAKKEKKGMLDKLGDSLVSAAKNAVNNLTGGLIGSLMNSKVDVEKLHDSFDKPHEETFLEYLASASLLVGAEDWIGESAGQVVRPLELQLGLYCQEATIPNLEIPISGQSVVN